MFCLVRLTSNLKPLQLVLVLQDLQYGDMRRANSRGVATAQARLSGASSDDGGSSDGSGSGGCGGDPALAADLALKPGQTINVPLRPRVSLPTSTTQRSLCWV